MLDFLYGLAVLLGKKIVIGYFLLWVFFVYVTGVALFSELVGFMEIMLGASGLLFTTLFMTAAPFLLYLSNLVPEPIEEEEPEEEVQEEIELKGDTWVETKPGVFTRVINSPPPSKSTPPKVPQARNFNMGGVPEILKREIVELYRSGVAQNKIAQSTGVSPASVSRIIQKYHKENM